MSKHFYFGATVFAILFVYIIDVMGAGVKPILVVGLAFLFSLFGAVLNELYERRTASESFERTMRGRLNEMSFELQILRDCKFHDLQSRACGLEQTMEALSKVLDAMKAEQELLKKAEDPNEAKAEEEPKGNATPNLTPKKR